MPQFPCFFLTCLVSLCDIDVFMWNVTVETENCVLWEMSIFFWFTAQLLPVFHLPTRFLCKTEKTLVPVMNKVGVMSVTCLMHSKYIQYKSCFLDTRIWAWMGVFAYLYCNCLATNPGCALPLAQNQLGQTEDKQYRKWIDRVMPTLHADASPWLLNQVHLPTHLHNNMVRSKSFRHTHFRLTPSEWHESGTALYRTLCWMFPQILFETFSVTQNLFHTTDNYNHIRSHWAVAPNSNIMANERIQRWSIQLLAPPCCGFRLSMSTGPDEAHSSAGLRQAFINSFG